MMLLCELMFFPPYTEGIQEGRGFTFHSLKHSSENAWKFHFLGSNMSLTPSVHMGITISVQAWKAEQENVIVASVGHFKYASCGYNCTVKDSFQCLT